MAPTNSPGRLSGRFMDTFSRKDNMNLDSSSARGTEKVDGLFCTRSVHQAESLLAEKADGRSSYSYAIVPIVYCKFFLKYERIQKFAKFFRQNHSFPNEFEFVLPFLKDILGVPVYWLC